MLGPKNKEKKRRSLPKKIIMTQLEGTGLAESDKCYERGKQRAARVKKAEFVRMTGQ